MADQTIDKLGVEFFSRVSPNFGQNLLKTIEDIQAKIKPALNQINNQWKSMGVNISAFFRMLREIPAIDMTKMINTQGILSQASQTFKQVRAESVKEMEALSSGVRKELNKAEAEFKKFSEIVAALKRGEDPIVEWGAPKFSKRTKSMTFPESQRAVGLEEYQRSAGSSEEGARKLQSEAITQYVEKQLGAYKQMEQAVGRIGAFERARIATQEIIAKAAQDELIARERIAEVGKIFTTLSEKGIISAKDPEYLALTKKYLEDIWRSEKDIDVLNRKIEDFMQSLIGKNERVRDIIMESLGVKKEEILTQEKLVELAEQVAKQYEKARVAAAGGVIGAGPAGQAAEWNRLIGIMGEAKMQVSEFQKRIQQINLRGFIKADEFERVQGLTSLINKEIDSLIAKLGAIGSQGAAQKLAEKFDFARKEIDEFAKKVKAGEIDLVGMNTEVQRLTANLITLGGIAKKQQLDMLAPATEQINKQIMGLTGGIDLNYKALQRSKLGMLDLEKVQGLLKDKLVLIRQEYDLLGGKSSPALNAQFKETTNQLALLGHHLQMTTGRTADAARAADRWGAGFKDMLKSQMAWLLGGALIFGTVFKIQQAFTEAIGTIFKFRQAIVDVGAITNASVDDMKLLEKAARDVAVSSKMGFMEAAEALKILGQAGLTAKESAETLKVVAMLVTATGASSQEAVKVLTTAMNVWGLSSKEATRVGNVLAAALNYSKLEVQDLAISFNYLAATAAQVGMSLEETAATIAVMRNAGIAASTIGTGLRGIIGQLIAPTKAFKDEIKSVGLSFEDIRMPGHNLIEILGTLEKAGFNLTNTFEGLEKRQAGVFEAMKNMGKEAFQRMTDALTGTNAMLVMNERAMEGPIARLNVFKNRLLDMALTTSGVVIPVFDAFLKFLNRMLDTFKDIAPILGFIAVMEILKVSFKNAGLAAEYLGKSLHWLRMHPILMWMTILAGAITAVRAGYDALKGSTDERLKQIDREVSLYASEVQQLETLKGMLNNVNTTQQQLRDSVAGLGNQYDSLKEIVNEVGFSHDRLKEKVIAAIDEWYKKIEKLKLVKMQLMIGDMDDLNNQTTELNRKMRETEAMMAQGTITEFGKGRLAATLQDLKKQSVEVGEKTMTAQKGISDLARSFKNLSEEAFKAAMSEEGYGKQAMEMAIIQRNVALEIDRQAKAKADSAREEARLTVMRKANLALEKEMATEREKEDSKHKEKMEEFSLKDLTEGGAAYKEALKGRANEEKRYQDRLMEIYQQERKKALAIGRQYYEDDAKERQRALEAELADIDLYSSGEEKIRKESLVRIQMLRLKGEQEIRRIFYEKIPGAEGKEGEDLGDRQKTIETMGKLRVDFQNQENRIIAKRNQDLNKFQENQEDERLKKIRDAEKESRQMRQEGTRARIAIAQTEGKEIAAQELITDEKLEDQQSKFYDRITQIYRNHFIEDIDISGKGHKLLEEALYTHNLEMVSITQQGEKAIVDAKKRAQAEELQRSQRIMQAKIEEAVRSQTLSLREMEKQYDELGEVARSSDFGKKMRYEISQLTVEVYQKHRDMFQEEADRLSKFADQSDTVKAHIAQLMESVERYNAKVRESRKFLAQWKREHEGMFAGIVDGFQDFSNKLSNEYEIGKQLAKDFGDSVYQGIHNPLADFFTGDLKSFGDYWRSFCKNLGQAMSKAVTDMIFEWIGLRRAMEGVGSGRGFNWGALFGGGGGGGAGVGSMGGEFGATEYSMGVAHGGGLVQDILNRIPNLHQGGTPSLGRDEVLMKMLTTEYALNSKATRSIGKQNLDYMNQTGKIPEASPSPSIKGELNIFNLTDREEFYRAMASSKGTNVLFNMVSANKEKFKRILVSS